MSGTSNLPTTPILNCKPQQVLKWHTQNSSTFKFLMSVFQTNAPYFLVYWITEPLLFSVNLSTWHSVTCIRLSSAISIGYSIQGLTHQSFYSNNSTKSILSSLVKTSKVWQFHKIKTGKLKIAMKNNLTTSWKHPPYIVYKATVNYSPFQHSNLTSHMN